MKWKLRNEKGQNLVEMALVMMLLLMLLAGAVDIGRAFHDYIIITDPAHEGRGGALACPARLQSILLIKDRSPLPRLPKLPIVVSPWAVAMF